MSVYFVPINPSSFEQGTYHRRPVLFAFTARPLTWWWDLDAHYWDTPPTAFPKARLLVDGVAVTDWVTRTGTTMSPTSGYRFNFDAADGHHIATCELDPPGVESLAKPFLVNTTGAPLPVQNPWTAPARFERQWGPSLGPGTAQVPYPGHVPSRDPVALKDRPRQPYSTLQAPQALWTRRITHHTVKVMQGRFTSTAQGDVAIERDQKYFYSDISDLGFRAPKQTVRDGPRGTGVMGVAYKGIYVPRDIFPAQGIVFSEVTGSLRFLRSDGTIETIVGWRLPKDKLKVHGDLWDSQSALYDAAWEYVGDWSQVPEPRRFNCPVWGFTFKPNPPESKLPGAAMEYWICDTRNGRILYVDLWTRHPASMYEKARYGPSWYVPPDAPTGQATVVQFVDPTCMGMREAGPADPHEPWDCTLGPDGKLYWTCFAGGLICRVNLDGTGAEIVCRTAYNPSDAELGITQRLFSAPPGRAAINRQQYLKPGPFGQAVFCRPQSIDFDSQGNLIVGCRYLHALLQFDLAAQQMSVVTLLANPDGFGTFDIAHVVDRQGECGPVDDILAVWWAPSSDTRFAKDGTRRARIIPTVGTGRTLTGRADLSSYCDYAWMPTVSKGRIAIAGNAAGYQCLEMTLKQPTDPAVDVARYQRGSEAYHLQGNPPMALTHGTQGQGELGFPTVDEMGAWDDATLRAYGASHGIPTDAADDWIYWVRIMCADNLYAPVNQPPGPLADMEVAVGSTVALSWPPATDDQGVVAYRVYRDGVRITETPAREFSEAVPPGRYVYGVAGVDAQGLEGPRYEMEVTA